MTAGQTLVVILAAGKGTRMKSALPKVLHAIAGRSLLGHVIAAGRQAGAGRLAVVVGPGMDDVRAEALREASGVEVFVQPDQLGTGDALRAAGAAFAGHTGHVLVLFGDTPFVEPRTLAAADALLGGGSDVVVVGFQAADPTGYGRILRDGAGGVTAIREHKDASPAELEVRLCNSGVMGFRGQALAEVLPRIGNANAKGEYYLTDAVEIARGLGLKVAAVECGEEEVLGINDRAQLAAAEALFQGRRRRHAMAEGATLVAPETVYFSHDTVLGRDVVVEPFVVFGPGVAVADGVTIRAFSHIVGSDRKVKSGCRIGAGAEVGPFARLRPGAQLGQGVHVGNFVEVKNAVLEDGAKANHLTYLGDARVGKAANIGAGTITCNYDGFDKHQTEIGAGAFIGSNSALVAPVRIGDGAIVGAGSVIAKEVAADALAVTRAPHDERPGWASRFRIMKQRKRKTG